MNPIVASLILQGISMGANAYANKKDAQQAEKAVRQADAENRQRTAYANLQNAFGGRAVPSLMNPQIKSPRSANLLRALGTGASVGSTLINANEAYKNAQAQNRLRDLQTQAATNQLEQQAGAMAQAAGGTVPIQVDEALRGTSQTLDAPIAGNSLLTPAFRAGAQQQEMDSLMQAAQLYKATSTGADKGADLARLEQTLKVFKPIVQSAAESGRTWKDLTAMQEFARVDPDAISLLQVEYENAAKAALSQKNKAVSDFLYGDLKSKWGSSELLKKSGDLIFGMNLMANGYNQENGVGDLMMVNAMVRLSDPGVSVKPVESLQMEEVGGVLERAKVVMAGEKFLEGNKFTDTVRNKLLTAAENLYTGQESAINGVLNREITAASPRFTQLGGTTDALRTFASTYYLPPIEEYGIKRRDVAGGSLLFGSAPAESTGLTGQDFDFLRRIYGAE